MIKNRVQKLEAAQQPRCSPESPIFIRQRTSGMYEVSNPESTGRIKLMTEEQIEARPRDHNYLFIMADGGVELEENT